MANQQNVTIFDGEVTTVEREYEENGAFGIIPVYYAPIFNGGESVRLTVNGVSRVYVAVDSSDIYTSVYIGNKWLPQRSANTAVEDDGSDYYISTSTGLAASTYFYSRNPGIYQLKIEIIPITAPALDPLSLFMGWKAGNWVARQRGKKKTPVAYLYNGVRLPRLPEWDKTVYPFAVIVYIDGTYFLWLMDSALIIGSDKAITIQQYTCTYNSWVEASQMSFTPSGHNPSYWDCLIWSNHDVWTIDSNTVNI